MYFLMLILSLQITSASFPGTPAREHTSLIDIFEGTTLDPKIKNKTSRSEHENTYYNVLYIKKKSISDLVKN